MPVWSRENVIDVAVPFNPSRERFTNGIDRAAVRRFGFVSHHLLQGKDESDGYQGNDECDDPVGGPHALNLVEPSHQGFHTSAGANRGAHRELSNPPISTCGNDMRIRSSPDTLP